MPNPAQQSSAPPLPQRSHAVLPQHGADGRRLPALPQPPALPSLLKRPAARWARGCLIAINLAAVAFFLLSYSRHGVSFGPYRIDLNVYRIGSVAWLHGGDLYGVLPPTSSGARLPFSYPPIAAVLLAPLALVPMPVAVTLLTTVTIALTALVLRVFLRSVIASPNVSWWSVCWVLPVALFLEPVRNTLNYGQVNVALMALVSADCLMVGPRWPRGALVGIAAAVKLTPAGFVLFFVLRRDWRAAGLAALSFCACTGFGFLVAWHDSVEYWTSVLFQGSRPGSPAYAANQSIQGVLARAGLDPHSPAGAVTWLVLSAVVVALACLGMRRAFAASADAWAMSLNAFACLLISPVSWSHHWVWGETAVLTLAILGWRGRARDLPDDRREHRGRTGRPDGPTALMPGRLCGAIAAAGAVLFAVSPQWWFPSGGNHELHWSAWEQAVGSSYVVFAAAVLLAAAGWPGRRPDKLSRDFPARGARGARRLRTQAGCAGLRANARSRSRVRRSPVTVRQWGRVRHSAIHSRSRSRKSAGRSSAGRWPTSGQSTRRAPAVSVTTSAAAACTVSRSSPPTRTSTGTAISPSLSRAGGSSSFSSTSSQSAVTSNARRCMRATSSRTAGPAWPGERRGPSTHHDRFASTAASRSPRSRAAPSASENACRSGVTSASRDPPGAASRSEATAGGLVSATSTATPPPKEAPTR